ncbi:MAG: DNA/RNA-binding protein Alba [Candidatus Methanofastidiosum methylothiophilum]|jgi:DNA-binding protein|uniref:DNA/RNA-binding protein Alba n=1 Tax=Candidatus Methanofastidiosum methylothiophilum TaxID=1705564 RepID=A0A150J6B4_9EURY|nr:MAG: DNA/RNA-binding protein Alba [Candidatus Methanofastidiosum methylthiophilus]MDY1592034.1 DNA-binding protein Alba [Methanofastidiosum sp.]HNU61146.1 DNA-binding protein Alba [Methanofastidiosum sp.]HOI76781.1 DNA-binding protein Alba [Methanofastidiosum sp.]
MSDENIVFVGSKPVMNYVLAVVTQLNKKETDNVVIKARGRAISRAVDVAEIVRNKFVVDVNVQKISTSTETITRDDNSSANVSAIEITLAR